MSVSPIKGVYLSLPAGKPAREQFTEKTESKGNLLGKAAHCKRAQKATTVPIML